MIRRPPRSTLDRSSAASDVYKRQEHADQRQQVERVPARGVRSDLDQRRVLAAGDEQRGPEAVSYTHLRAHETVLDLVCRLLLEKKKKHEDKKKQTTETEA